MTATDAGTQLPRSADKLRWPHYKAILLSSLGGILEYYEFTIFIFVSPLLTEVFFPADVPGWLRQAQTMGIYAVGYLTRPLGGLLLATIGDRWGRKRAFAVGILLMASATLAIGLLPSYRQAGVLAPLLLLVCRLIQGFALGSELPTAIVLVAEHVPGRRRGLAFGMIGASFGLGFVLSATLLSLLSNHLSHSQLLAFGWRIPFAIGGLFGAAVLVLRRYLLESPAFLRLRASLEGERGARSLLGELWHRHRPALGWCLLLSVTPGILIPAVQLYPATYFVLHQHLPLAQVAHAQLLMQIGTCLGAIAGGWWMDRVGWYRSIPLAAAALVIALLGFYQHPDAAHLSLWFFVLGALVSYVVMFYAPLVLSFPTQLRLTGIALVYNLSAAVFSGTTPLLLGLWTIHGAIALALYPALACLIGVTACLGLRRLHLNRIQP